MRECPIKYSLSPPLNYNVNISCFTKSDRECVLLLFSFISLYVYLWIIICFGGGWFVLLFWGRQIFSPCFFGIRSPYLSVMVWLSFVVLYMFSQSPPTSTIKCENKNLSVISSCVLYRTDILLLLLLLYIYYILV